MKNLIQSITACIALLTGFGLQAQSQPKENSLLWEVTGKGLTSPSYLYGTVHMICEKDFFMKDKVANAFAKTATLALEINMSDPQELTVMQQSAMGATKLSATLSPQQQKDLNEVVQKNTGLTLEQVDGYTLSTVMSLVLVKSFGCDNLKFYEMEFIAKAKEKNIPVIGLETVQSQMDILNTAYTTDEMIGYLKTVNVQESQKLVNDYVKEDINAMYTAFNDPKVMNEKTKTMMLDNRNRNWIEKMPDLMKKGSVFFAVGAAHLPGDAGIIYLLRKAGYTLKPVLK